MNRLVLLGITIYLLAVFGLIILSGSLLALIIPLLIFLAPAILFGPEEPQVRLERDVSIARATEETPVKITLRVSNEGSRLEMLHLKDAPAPGLSVIEGDTELLTSLDAGETIELNYTVRGIRGRYDFGPVAMRVSDLFGLLVREVVQEAPGEFEFHVFPPVVSIDRIPIRPRQTKVYAGYIPARIGGSGVEFFNVRDYRPGDSLRHINWRANARHRDTLFTNEFQQERVADVGIILDARQGSYVEIGGKSLFEHAVLAAAALADSFLDAGNRVALLRYGDFLDWTVPGYGKFQRERILRALARAQTGDSLIFDQLEHLPTRLFPTRSQLVMVSPLTRDDVEFLRRLRGRGYHLLIVSPDPVTFEERILGDGEFVGTAARIARLERALVISRLRQVGVPVLDWQVDVPLEQAVRTFAARIRPLVAHGPGVAPA